MQAAETDLRQSMIARAAYFRAEKRHFTPGHEMEDWLEAEREVDMLLKNRETAQSTEPHSVEAELLEETAMEEAFEEAEARQATPKQAKKRGRPHM